MDVQVIEVFKEGNDYTVDLRSVAGLHYRHNAVEVNGKIYAPRNTPSSEEDLLTTSEVPVIRLVNKVSMIVGYRNKETNDVISSDKLSSLTADLNEKIDATENLSLKEAYNKELTNLRDSYEAISDVSYEYSDPLLISVLPVVPREDFITPARYDGGQYTTLKGTYYRKSCIANEYRRLLNDMGYQERKNSFSDTKSSNNYAIFETSTNELSISMPGGVYIKKHISEQCVGNVPELSAMKRKDIEETIREVQKWERNNNIVYTKANFCSDVEAIKDLVIRMSPKTKADRELRDKALMKIKQLLAE